MTNDWDDTVSIPGTLDEAPTQGRAYLVVVRGSNVGEMYPVTLPEMVIGRAAGANLRLNDEGVSRFHCRLRQDASGIVVEDLASRNGTFCNSERLVPGMRTLAEGDRLQVGTTSVLRFTYEESMETTSVPRVDDQSGGRDPLTGMFSGRTFVDRLQAEVELALRHRSPLSLLLLQIDRLDEISARSKGLSDQIFLGVAQHIVKNVRDDDIVARFATGEFALMSRAASPGDTFMLASRLRAANTGITVETADGAQKVTLSLAVAALTELRIHSANELLIAANTALHRAKIQGGDRVVLCTQDLLREPKDWPK